MMPRIINHLYECDICGKREQWNDNWNWYGSLNDMDNENLPTLCSIECREKFDKRITRR